MLMETAVVNFAEEKYSVELRNIHRPEIGEGRCPVGGRCGRCMR